MKTELAQREGELAQREEEVGTHLETARRMQEQMEYMLKIELAQREEELAQREEEVGTHLEATRRMQDQMKYMLRQEQAEQVKEQAELVRRLRRELQEESCAKRAVQSRLEKAEALIAEQAELIRSLKLQAEGYTKRAVQSRREKIDSYWDPFEGDVQPRRGHSFGDPVWKKGLERVVDSFWDSFCEKEDYFRAIPTNMHEHAEIEVLQSELHRLQWGAYNREAKRDVE